jgi:drug/metabolite transporter (DMT)-like permease
MEKKKSVFSTALKYAIIVGLIGFIWGIIVYAAHLYLNSWYQWIGVGFMFIGLIFVVRERRDKDLGGFITFGQAFNVGFMFCMLLGVISILGNILLTQVIATDMMPEIMKYTEQKMVDKGMSDDQIAIAMKYTRMFTTPLMQAVIGILFTAILGAILSLITAAIFKKENPNLQAPQA